MSSVLAQPIPLARPPESMRPDRPEVMNSVGTGLQVELARGVNFECLVGSHNQARRLTTGIVTFAPGATLSYHNHTFSESITLLSGSAIVDVEGRRYTMRDSSTALQPRGRVHYFINESPATMEMLWVYAGPKPEHILVEECCATEVGNPWR